MEDLLFMHNSSHNPPEKRSRWSVFVFVTYVLVSLPLFAAAVATTIDFSLLPPEVANVVRGRLMSAALFSFGLACGLVGTGISFVSRTAEVKRLGAAVVVFGLSHVVLGFILRPVLEPTVNGGVSLLYIFALPGILWIYSFYLAFTAFSKASHNEK